MVRSDKLFLGQMSLVLSAFSLASFLMLSSSGVSATTTSATASVIVPSACTMTSTVNNAHTAIIANGTSQSNIGKTTFNVVCNDGAGFAIYAVGYSNDEYGNNKLLATIGGVLTPGSDIATGTATSGSTSNWAMKLTAVSGTYAPTIHDNYDSGSYHTVPSTYTKVASYSSATDASIGSSLEATYQAYISPTAPAGSYNGTVRYTMVHPATELPNMPRACSSNKICYWPNGDGEVADRMGDQSTSANSSANLWPSNFQRPGYGFAGWSDKYDWVLNENDVNGNGTGKNEGYHIYGPNATITTPSDMSNGISLYAVWAPSQGTLQSFTTSQCTAMDVGEVTALTDTRDNDTYAVAKLADGNCWMIENLRLADKNSSNSYITLTIVNTNNPLNDGTNVNLTLNPSGVGNHLSDSVNPSSNSAWCISTNSTCLDKSMLSTLNTVNPDANMSSVGANIYSYGNYYNWYSATAGRGKRSNDANNSSVAGDICPSGWRLPQGGDKDGIANSDFWELGLTIVGLQPANTSSETYPKYVGSVEGTNASGAFRSFPNNYVYSGYIANNSVDNRGVFGYLFSSTASDYQTAYVFDFGNISVYPGTNKVSKYRGVPVRCIAHS